MMVMKYSELDDVNWPKAVDRIACRPALGGQVSFKAGTYVHSTSRHDMWICLYIVCMHLYREYVCKICIVCTNLSSVDP